MRVVLLVVLGLTLVPMAGAAEYWAASLPVGFTGRPSTLVLGNLMPGTESAVLEDAGGVVGTLTLPGGGGATQVLGPQLKGSQITSVGTMRIETTSAGVVGTVYTTANPDHFMNDASRLVKTAELGMDHVVSAWHAHHPLFPHKSWIVVLGTENATTVTVTPRAAVTAGGGVPAMTPGFATSVLIDRFDALVMFSNGDLSGSRVQSNRPIAVFSGSECSNVGASGSCDELSEQIPPLDYATDEYVVCSSVPFRVGSAPQDVLRVMSAGGAIGITVNGVAAGAVGATGEYLDVTVSGDAHVQTSGPSFVAVHSAERSDDDPAFVMPVGPERYARQHHVHAMAGWPVHMAQVAAPAGTALDVDGIPWVGSPWRAVGSSGYACSEQPLLPGPHMIEASDKVGVMVYGVGDDAGAWYRTDGDCLLFAVPPDAPVPLTLSLAGTTAALAWERPADDGGCPVLRYDVYRGPTTTGPWTLIGSTQERVFTDPSPERCQDHAYHVRAVTRAGEGPMSNVVSMFVAAPPGPPVLDAPEARTIGGYVHLTWDLPLDDGGCPIEEVAVYQGTPGGVAAPASLVLGPAAIEAWVRPPPCEDMAFRVDVATRMGRSVLSNEETSRPTPDLPECMPPPEPDGTPIVPESSDSDGDGAPDPVDACPADRGCGGTNPDRSCPPGEVRDPRAAWHALHPSPLDLGPDDAWVFWRSSGCAEGFLVFAGAEGPLVAYVPHEPWRTGDTEHAAPGRVYWVQPGDEDDAFDPERALPTAPLAELPGPANASTSAAPAPSSTPAPAPNTAGPDDVALEAGAGGLVLWPFLLLVALALAIVGYAWTRRA